MKRNKFIIKFRTLTGRKTFTTWYFVSRLGNYCEHYPNGLSKIRQEVIFDSAEAALEYARTKMALNNYTEIEIVPYYGTTKPNFDNLYWFQGWCPTERVK
jgi:hypothetical protein